MKKVLALVALTATAHMAHAASFSTETFAFAGAMNALAGDVENKLAEAVLKQCPSGKATIGGLTVTAETRTDVGAAPLVTEVVTDNGGRASLFFPAYPLIKLNANINCTVAK